MPIGSRKPYPAAGGSYEVRREAPAPAAPVIESTAAPEPEPIVLDQGAPLPATED